MNTNKGNQNELYQAIVSLRDVKECEAFFEDLCTPQELLALADRWKVARLLNKQIPYRIIQQKTGVSTATVTRVARSLQFGQGGYQAVLDRKIDKEK